MKLKLNMRNSITKKLFLITVVIFISFLVFTFISQRVFFERMYYNKKKVDIANNVMKFNETLSTAKSEEEILIAMKEYDDKYNTFMAIFNTANNVTVIFNTGHTKVDVQNSNMVRDIINEIKYNQELNLELARTGKITFEASDPRNDTKSLVSVLGEGSKIIVGFTSIQSITEAVGVIEIFYKYFYMAAIVAIILLSLIYTKMITKPLKRINNIAIKMAHLDFDEKCEVDSEDEIGSLSKSLNFLSSKLQEALFSLQSANEKLRRDIHKERQLETMRKEFIADVSHELKTPITLIKGYAEGIKDDVFSKEEVDYSLDVILSESDKMNNLVKEMLELSSLESENTILKTEICNLGEIIEGTIRKLKPSFEEKEINVHVDLQKGLTVKGDPFKLEQVATNFLTNAIRHTNFKGDIWITSNFVYEKPIPVILGDGVTPDSNMKPGKGKIYISIENSGSSIAEEDLEKIWLKFYKRDKSRNRSLGGTGLGLSIVKKIIELHQGFYGVRNTEKGVMFYFGMAAEQWED
jgi:two-component system, OmpR family, sensor histidine kinase VanS